MATGLSSYYGLTRVREMSPDAKDWAATDGNVEVISLLLKALEQHRHDASTAMNFPGYNVGTPTSPTLAALTQSTSGGIITPGTTVGVRLAYLDSLGLETQASPETNITLGTGSTRPNPPTLTSIQPVASTLTGGTYIYVVTKVKASGETLASDILPVTIPYSATHSVTLAFNSISSYTDGTDAINIYRSNGLNAVFQLVTTITVGATASFTDTNAIAAGNQNVQPPTVTTFDAARKVTITWSGLGAHPSTASKLRVYVTQQSGIWGARCLLAEIALTGTPPTFIDYLGSEALGTGTPLDATQLVTGSPKINLSTEATGAPTLTANMNFGGFQAQNMLLHSTVAPTTVNGAIYYDTSLNNVRARINGAWVNWGVTAGTGYTHPAEESGGHLAANIKFVTAGTTVKTILDRIADSAGAAKQVQSLSRVIGVTNNPTTANTASSSSVFIPEMTLTTPATTFNNQWMSIYLDCQFQFQVAGQLVHLAIEVDGVTGPVRTWEAAAASQDITVYMPWEYQVATPQTDVIKVLWWTSTGSITAVGVRRVLTAKLVF